MILYLYIHWFWITFLWSGPIVAMPIEPADAVDSPLPIVLRPVGNSLGSNVGNNPNLIHPNRTVTTISTSISPDSTDSTTLRTSTTVLSTLLDHHDAVKENDMFIQPRINVAEMDKPKLVSNISINNDSSNIVAMGYTNNSFEEQLSDNDTDAIANITDTELLETTLNISHSSASNSNLIDNSSGNIGPGEGQLTAAGITGITVGCVSIVGLLSAISFFLYRYRTLNRPEALNDYCSNLDSSGYIDDTSIRDNSEEMYSLDNDSFLNSLEAMTIQNYWTDKVKHTKL